MHAYVLYCSKKFCFKQKPVTPATPNEMSEVFSNNGNKDSKGDCHYEEVDFNYNIKPNPGYGQVAGPQQGSDGIYEN